MNTYPQVFIGNTFVGGCDDVKSLVESKKIFEIMDKENVVYHIDL